MAQGRKTGGRQKGSRNKVDSTAKEAFLLLFGKLAPDLEGWIRDTADEDPAKAADLTIRLAEYHFPKLARSEMTGKDEGPIVIERRTHVFTGNRPGPGAPPDLPSIDE